MTHSTDDLIPENYYLWPRSVQRHYIQELHALYFPERYPERKTAQPAAIAPTIAQQPGDDVVGAEVIE